MSQIIIRQLTTIEQLEQTKKIEQTVWNMSPIPVHQKFTVTRNGGIVLGAFDEEEMIGFLYSFPGQENGKLYLCSHLLGIIRAYRGRGIGVKLKRAQRTYARQKGYTYITWTYDPLESRNAYINVHKLQAIGASYKVNYYGTLDDDLNKGLPSDRMQVTWNISEETPRRTNTFIEEHVLIQNDKNNPIVHDRQNLSERGPFFIAIPKNFQKIKETDSTLAKKWRTVTRKVMQRLFANGFHATDVLKDTKNNVYYVFTRQERE